MTEIIICPDVATLNETIASAWVEQAENSIQLRNSFHIALSGGSTPNALYQLMASEPYRNRIDWSKHHIWFGDERCVPHTHVDSNYRMACEAMINSLPFPPENIHPIPTDATDPADNAAACEKELLACLQTTSEGVPQFDLMLQGVGGDGHTASLFPGTSILHEQEKYVAAAYVEKLDAWRISVTFPVINHARQVFMLVAGEGKADMVHTLIDEPVPETPYPVQMIKSRGRFVWYLDEAAAAKLSTPAS